MLSGSSPHLSVLLIGVAILLAIGGIYGALRAGEVRVVEYRTLAGAAAAGAVARGWIPSRACVNPLRPGELIRIAADTALASPLARPGALHILEYLPL